MGNHLNKKNVELSLLSIQIGWRHIGCTQVFRVTVLREGLNDWRRLAYEVCHFTRRSNFDIVIKNYEVKKRNMHQMPRFTKLRLRSITNV